MVTRWIIPNTLLNLLFNCSTLVLKCSNPASQMCKVSYKTTKTEWCSNFANIPKTQSTNNLYSIPILLGLEANFLRVETLPSKIQLLWQQDHYTNRHIHFHRHKKQKEFQYSTNSGTEKKERPILEINHARKDKTKLK